MAKRTLLWLAAAAVVVVLGGVGLTQAFGGEREPAEVKQAEPDVKAEPAPEHVPPTNGTRGVVHTALAGTAAPMKLIGLTGGEFTMGSPDAELGHDAYEGPQHRVAVAAFELCATEVSLAQYEIVMGEGKRPNECKEGCDDQHPVTRVSWRDAAHFLNALTRRENEQGAGLTLCYDETTWAWNRACTGYRLPTEAEWEYAARAGSTTAWHFGSDEKDLCRYANVDTNACTDGFDKLAPVETDKLEPNAWGLHGMHGNVWEWVFDVYAPFGTQRVENPAVTSDGNADPTDDKRVLRGGSFVWSQGSRSAIRSRNPPVNWYWNVGFRCARGAVPQP